MKKLIFCVHGFPGNGGGGTFNLIKYLPRYGYEPIVITNGHKITSLPCAMGDTKVRVGRELDRKNAPSASYIMRTRDCSDNKLEIINAYFQSDIRY